MRTRLLWRGIYLAAVAIFLLFTLGPVLWCLIISITPEAEMFRSGVGLIPAHATLENYARLLGMNSRESTNFMEALSNSLITAGATILIGLPIAVAAGYALARLKVRGGRILLIAMLLTMPVPILATIIPLYALYATIGLLDNHFALAAVYVSSTLPLVTWIITNHFRSFPDEIEQAALMDGAGRVRLFFDVVLPVSYPIVLSAALVMFLWAWGQYMIPLILASSRATKPLSVMVAEFSSKEFFLYGMTAAAGILAMLAPAVFAVVFRRYLISGLTEGGVE